MTINENYNRKQECFILSKLLIQLQLEGEKFEPREPFIRIIKSWSVQKFGF